MPDAPKTGSTDRPYAMALALVFQLGLMIAIPVFILGLGGAYADRHLGTSPYLVIAGFLTAFIFSTVIVWQRVKAVVKATNAAFPPRRPKP